MQLVKYNVQLVDIYGIIGTQRVNTLEHLGVSFDWSVYSPTKKAELLEAERAKDEMRDIMSRMIGAEIRYVRMGYRVRPSPYGYVNEKIETSHGRRVILKPHPVESQFIIKMYKLKARGDLKDDEIVSKINNLGYKSRIHYIRSPRDRLEIIGQRGGTKLNVKRFLEYIKKPIYAGINDEKWTNPEPVKTKFPGLISIELFNQANRGKIRLTEKDGGVKIYKNKPDEWRLIKKHTNPNFPYKRYVLCPQCRYPLYGSASRGRLGKYYPAYHCNKRNHYFRVPIKEFEDTIQDFVRRLRITKEGINKFKEVVLNEWNVRLINGEGDIEKINQRIEKLENEKVLIGDKLTILVSEEAIRIIEKKLKAVTTEIKDLKEAREKKEDKNINMELVMEIVVNFLEHLEFLLLGSPNPLKRAAYFGLVFAETPTYQELVSGTPKLAPYIKLIQTLDNPQFRNGEPYRNRTCNLFLKRELLYQLS